MSQDRALVEAVLANAPGAFTRLVRQYQGLCWHITYRMVQQPADAEDLCQETFLRVHRYLHQYRYESALKSWIGRIAYSVTLRHLEHKGVPLVEDPSDSGEVALLENITDGLDVQAASENADSSKHLYEALDSLPALPRTLMTLYHIEGLSIPEITRITGIAAGTIKSHLFRTPVRLRVLLKTLTGVGSWT